MFSRNSGAFGRGRGAVLEEFGEPVITVLVPWSQQFGLAYQQFVNGGGYGGGLGGGYGGLGGGFGQGLGGGYGQGLGGGYGGLGGGYGQGLGGGYGQGLGGYGGGLGREVQCYPIGFGVTNT